MKVLLAAPLLLVGLAVGAMPAKADPGDCTFAVYEIPQEIDTFAQCVENGQPVCILIAGGRWDCGPACIDFDAIYGPFHWQAQVPDLARYALFSWSFAGVGSEGLNPSLQVGYYDVAIDVGLVAPTYCEEEEHV